MFLRRLTVTLQREHLPPLRLESKLEPHPEGFPKVLLSYKCPGKMDRYNRAAQPTPGMLPSISIQQQASLKWYIDSARRAPRIVPKSILGHLVAFCV